MEAYIAQIVIGYIVPFILERLKKASWFTPLTENSLHIVKVGWAWVAAAASAVGVSFMFDAQQHQLVIKGLDITTIWHGGVMFLIALIMQKFTYRLAIQPKPPTT